MGSYIWSVCLEGRLDMELLTKLSARLSSGVSGEFFVEGGVMGFGSSTNAERSRN